MAENVKRVVTADVYAWMTPIEGVPGRYHHNTAARGEEIEVSAAEAKRGEGLGFLADGDAVKAAAQESAQAEQEAATKEAEAATALQEAADARTLAESASATGDLADLEPAAADRPPRAANKAAWVDYAVAQGADRGEAEAMSKDDLVAAYGA